MLTPAKGWVNQERSAANWLKTAGTSSCAQPLAYE
jgi:hypothetical protein